MLLSLEYEFVKYVIFNFAIWRHDSSTSRIRSTIIWTWASFWEHFKIRNCKHCHHVLSSPSNGHSLLLKISDIECFEFLLVWLWSGSKFIPFFSHENVPQWMKDWFVREMCFHCYNLSSLNASNRRDNHKLHAKCIANTIGKHIWMLNVGVVATALGTLIPLTLPHISK